MKPIILGRSGLVVSPLCLGAMTPGDHGANAGYQQVPVDAHVALHAVAIALLPDPPLAPEARRSEREDRGVFEPEYNARQRNWRLRKFGVLPCNGTVVARRPDWNAVGELEPEKPHDGPGTRLLRLRLSSWPR